MKEFTRIVEFKRMSDETTGNEKEDIVTAALVVIGDEILSGRTKDKNIGYIADHFTAIGIRLQEVRIVADIENDIIKAINELRNKYSYVLTTGGIGPTHDDITADSIAKAFGVPIDVDPRAVEMMLERYNKDQLNEARLRMARIPEGADLIDNIISRTPGFMIENVIVMAGIPNVMQVMLDAVTPKLRTGRTMLSTVVEVDAPEGELAEILKAAQDDFPDVAMGSYPYFRNGLWGANLVLRNTTQNRLDSAEKALISMLKDKGILSTGD